MRQLLLMAVLFAGAGCQGLRDRLDCRSCEEDRVAFRRRPLRGGPASCEPAPTPCKDRGGPGPQDDTKKEPQRGAPTDVPVRGGGIPQEVLLVPKTVYVPYMAQTPTTPARLTVPSDRGNPEPPKDPKDRGNPTPPAPCPPGTNASDPCVREMLDLCKKLHLRMDQIDSQLHKGRPVLVTDCPPNGVLCPPAPRLFPNLFRRPVFLPCDRSAPCLPDCEPSTTPGGVLAPSSVIPIIPSADPEPIAAPRKKLPSSPTGQ